MALAYNNNLNETACPVSDAIFIQIKNSSQQDVLNIISSLGEDRRAQLAAFCYERRHFHYISILIASTCSMPALVRAMGTAGKIIFDQSRTPGRTIENHRRAANEHLKKTVSLPKLSAFQSLKPRSKSEIN